VSLRPDTLAGKVLGDLRSEVYRKLEGFTEEKPFEGAVTLPVAETGPFDYIVVGYRNKAAELRDRLFGLRAAMVGHTATFELRPADESDRALALSPRQLAGAAPDAAAKNGDMEVVGLKVHVDSGAGMAYGDFNERGLQRAGAPRLRAQFHLSHFVQQARLDPSTARAVEANDFALTMLDNVVILGSSLTQPDQIVPPANIAGAA
jgi:hypothetical protein